MQTYRNISFSTEYPNLNMAIGMCSRQSLQNKIRLAPAYFARLFCHSKEYQLYSCASALRPLKPKYQDSVQRGTYGMRDTNPKKS